VTAYGWRATSNNTAKLACSPLKQACGIIMSPLLALSRHSRAADQCVLSGVKRTWLSAARMSANDLKRTLRLR
jgi:hypothetical protein